MRGPPVGAALVVLAALPAAVLAASGPALDPVPAGPAAGDEGVVRVGQYGVRPPSTGRPLVADGAGSFSWQGAGAVSVSLARTGTVRVWLDPRAAAPARRSAGLRADRPPRARRWTAYSGRGSIALDGPSYRVEVASPAFHAVVDPPSAGRIGGVARASGRGQTILAGGAPVGFDGGQRIVLTRAPLRVDLADGAFWRLAGPVNGTVDMTVRGRLQVWDASPGRDLTVAGPGLDRPRGQRDGSVLYGSPRGGRVVVAGSAWRMRVSGAAVAGVLTQPPRTVARVAVEGQGGYTAGAGGAPERARGRLPVTRILLWP